MKQTANNTFEKGLNMDLHPIVTPNSVLTDNLNGTFITYDGNELTLQNDRGNVEKASLHDGFIAIGAKEHHGVIYIISANQEGDTEVGIYPGFESDENGIKERGTLSKVSYTPLMNLLDKNNGKQPLVAKFGYTPSTPVTIEVQDSYDGSVNLIVVAKGQIPRIINSGFSVKDNGTYEIITRNGEDLDRNTNIYKANTILYDTELIRSNYTISNVKLDAVEQGGQLKGGNYTFYIKFGDADYNQTDVVAESGIVSVFNGTDGKPLTISGTLLDERTNKLVRLRIENLNHVYSKIYVYYTREYSDTRGFQMTECSVLREPFDMSDTIYQDITITGYEQTETVNIEELNAEYHTVASVRAEAQQANMLFLGNIKHKDTNALYEKLKDFTLKHVSTSLGQDSMNAMTLTYDGGEEYYSTDNIYNRIGYWPEEYYRFGIVYILEDGTTTPVFNMTGGIFNNIDQVIKERSQYADGESIPELLNEYGVFKTPRIQIINCKDSSGNSITRPLYFSFDLDVSDLETDGTKVIGYFIVRQKRIPTTLCQGVRLGIDSRTHLPITWNGKMWMTQSFLSLDRDTRQYKDEHHNTGDPHTVTNKPLEFRPLLRYDNNSIFTNATKQDREKTAESSYPAINTVYIYQIDTEFEHYINEHQPDGSTNHPFIDWKLSDDQYDEAPVYMSDDLYTASSRPAEDPVYYYRCKRYDYVDDEFVDSESDIIYVSEESLYDFTTVDATQKTEASYVRFNLADSISSAETARTINETQKQAYVNGLGESITAKYKYIMYTKWSKSYKSVDPMEDTIACNGYGLLSLDPCVNPTIGSILDGSEFNVVKEYSTTTKFGIDDNLDYYHTNNVSGSYLQVQEENNVYEQNSTNNNLISCAYIPPDTAMKAVGDIGFSNVAGNAKTVKNFVYTRPVLLGYAKQTTTGGNDNNYHYKVRYLSSKEKETLHSVSDDDPGFDSNDNVNLVRGKFTPYIGLATTSLSEHGIYSVRLKGASNSNSILVRQNDESEYYTVSERNPIATRSINVYRGDCYVCTVSMRIISNFIDDTAPVSTIIVDPRSWIRNVNYDKQMFEADKKPDYDSVNLSDVNTVDLGYWVTFKCLSSQNLGLRSQDTSHEDEMALMGSARSFVPLNGGSTSTGNKLQESYLLNAGLSSTVGRKRYNLIPKVPYIHSEFENRIMFSNVHVDSSYSNGYRVFQGISYQDYDKQYGEITKLLAYGNNIFCVMEHGLALIPVNEKALMQTTTGEAIHIYGRDVLPQDMTIVSQDYGSKYEHSVIRTPLGIYGVDADAKKIWRFTQQKGFETISDLKIESYLNDNLFSNVDTNLGNIDIRAHYNALKGDVMFSFYNLDEDYLYLSETGVTVIVGEQRIVNIDYNRKYPIEVTVNNDNVNVTVKDDKLILTGVSEGESEIIIKSGNKTMSLLAWLRKRAASGGSSSSSGKIVARDVKIVPAETYVRVDTGDSVTVPINIVGGSIAEMSITCNEELVDVEKTEDGVKITGVAAGSTNVTLTIGAATASIMTTVNRKRLLFDYTIQKIRVPWEVTFVCYNNTGMLTASEYDDTKVQVAINQRDHSVTLTPLEAGDWDVTITDEAGLSETITVRGFEYVGVQDVIVEEPIPEVIEMKVGDFKEFHYYFVPSNISDRIINYTNSNRKVVRATATTGRTYDSIVHDYVNPYVYFEALAPGTAKVTLCFLHVDNEHNSSYVPNPPKTFNIHVTE